MLPVAAFIAISSFPGQALAFTQTIEDTHKMTFPSGQIISGQLSPASYLFEEGSILGVSVSAYSSTKDQTDGNPFVTASGTMVREGVAAANFLPIGTTVTIFGRIYTIEDRMNARYNDRYTIDVWMASREEALDFGSRRTLLEVVNLP
ncbi:MAG: 3D domain-containing protein [Candidatus Andersenbacteria bacterium]|nr:3D domain-containing protein [Candidatus Andersenbacteria bacterium]MBI3250698.1 3D domain-containing protein [Candidatus Andersenbacteria bacterium]